MLGNGTQKLRGMGVAEPGVTEWGDTSLASRTSYLRYLCIYICIYMICVCAILYIYNIQYMMYMLDVEHVVYMLV